MLPEGSPHAAHGRGEDPGWQTAEAREMLDQWERDARENLERYRKEQR
jgi:hypothetical protein